MIDGQGGGIGTTIITRIEEVHGEQVEVWALGTKAIATARMMKARQTEALPVKMLFVIVPDRSTS